MTNAELQEKIAKLPKWAQEYIADLNRTAARQDEHYEKLQKSFTGEQKTNVRLRLMHGDKDIFIPDEAGIEFTMADGSIYEIRFDGGWRGYRGALRVSQNYSFRSSIVVAPSTANVVYIKSVKD